MALTMVDVGDIKRIIELRAKDSIKKHLQSLGFLVGEEVEVISDNPSGLIIMIKGTKIALNRGMANKVIVQ